MSAPKLILVIGANGFLGRHVLDRMLACNYSTRVLMRGGGDWKDSNVSMLRSKGIEVVLGDVTHEETVAKAVQGTAGIINMAGLFQEDKDASFEDLHVKAVELLTKYGSEARVQRFVHISCLGASSNAECRYYSSKWKGEEVIRNSKFFWTILRPSFMFGSEFPLLSYLKPLLTFKLFLPVIGSGTNIIQPIFVEDVADCVVQSLYERSMAGNSYDLVGPDEYTMLELLEMARHELGMHGNTVNISTQFSGKAFDMLTKALPRSILNNDLIGLMSENSTSSRKQILDNFEVRNVALDQMLPEIIESLSK